MNAADSTASHAREQLFRTLAELRGASGVIHGRFGDLSRPDAVSMPAGTVPSSGYAERDDSIIHLTVTGRCNAHCQGCINTAFNSERRLVAEQFECDPVRDAGTIARVVGDSGDRQVTVALYGGEPLLEMDRVARLLDAVAASPVGRRTSYMLYTNGQLLAASCRAYPHVWRHIRLVSVSIDGEKAQHERYRPGTDLDEIERGLAEMRSAWSGEILLWSTLREPQSLLSCFRQYLDFFDRSLVRHFFWHWAESTDAYADLRTYAACYGEELEHVLDTYVDRLRGGTLLPIAHINELVLYLLTGRVRGHSACAVERAENLDIVGGRVTACADLPLDVGVVTLDANGLCVADDLQQLVSYRGVLGCEDCGVFPYCGGRCPVQVLSGSPVRTLQICQLMRLHVGLVMERMGAIRSGLEAAGITPQGLYDASAFMARYTDVVP